MKEPANYVEKVYAAVLGKVIGVYVGKPFEGWFNKDIEARLGEIWYYVHDRLNYPLVASDDDISGTFTFARAMEDHDAWRSVTSEQIGKTWLNYLIEHQTVLWWGGMGVSTEHTAWLRLAAGIPAPRSGSIELNGQTVAEQIGAQIFIDGFGLVAPGDPELAARLAGEAGRVSHDGEAVYAAQALAAMEAAAFTENRMDKLFEVARSVMPKGCLMARLYDDVLGWAARHGDDWRKTLARIQAKYGYDKYGGGCHMVPNHAVMVMAWAHAADDFQKSLMIANTAGWDTDCNSGNVGCLMGVKGGLAGIAAGPDWQRPFADRVIIPTAEGTRGITDCLREADLIARYGRKVMGWAGRPAPKKGARFHFSQPGSMHGFLAERDVAAEDNVYLHNPSGQLRIEFKNVAPGKPARAVTPTFLTPDQLARSRSGYALAVAPTLYSGQTITAAVRNAAQPAAFASAVNVRLFVRYYVPDEKSALDQKASLTGVAMSEPVRLAPGRSRRLQWIVPDTRGWPVAQLGLQIETHQGTNVAAGIVELDWLTWSGSPMIDFKQVMLQARGQGGLLGWIGNCGLTYRDAWGPRTTLVSNHGLGLLHTGTAEWGDYTASARLAVRLANRAGLAARYGGLRRYVAVVFNRPAGELQLIRQFDEQLDVLAGVPCDWQLNEAHQLKLAVRGQHARAFADGKKLFDADFAGLAAGGIACLSDAGTTSFADVKVTPPGKR